MARWLPVSQTPKCVEAHVQKCQFAGFRPSTVIDYLAHSPVASNTEEQLMEGSGLFVSSCSRRELARRRSASRFWTKQNLMWLLLRRTSSSRRSSR
jgi:hypothetical protein